MGQNVSQSRATVFARQGGLVKPVRRHVQVVIMETAVSQSALVKMAPHAITCWARARVRLGGRVTIAHEDVPKVSSATDVLHDASVAMVTGGHVML